MADDKKSIPLKLLVDKEKNRVVFAESDKDFVDILFSFLTLPIGTIVRLLDKKSSLGCIDRLYESVENLDKHYFQTKACKNMLLSPRAAAEIECEELKINADDLQPTRIYRCPAFDCFTKTHRLYSLVCGVPCRCGKEMGKAFQWTRSEKVDECNGDGVFVKGVTRFIISDDLHVTPVVSMGETVSLLQKLGIRDAQALEKRTVNVSRNEVLNLLKKLLTSTAPLTEVFLPKPESNDGCNEGQKLQPAPNTQIKQECDAAAESKMIHLTLLYNQKSNKVLFAQAGEDFMDILFSFLTFALGSIVKLLGKHSCIGCLNNLYESVESLGVGSDYIKSEECKNMLLAPKLSPHFGCSNQLLRIEEKPPRGVEACACESCWNGGITCKHGIGNAKLTKINPKLPNTGTEFGGGYAKMSAKFMVTGEMAVTPLSPLSGIDLISESKSPICSLAEKEITIGENEALNLLKASLFSRTALADVFSSGKRRRIPSSSQL